MRDTGLYANKTIGGFVRPRDVNHTEENEQAETPNAESPNAEVARAAAKAAAKADAAAQMKPRASGGLAGPTDAASPGALYTPDARIEQARAWFDAG